MKKVAVIMGSDSDWPVVKAACAQLEALDIPFEAHILSAHRTPAAAADFAKNAAVLAAQILAVEDAALAARLEAERTAMAAQIAEKETKLQAELGR